MTTIPTSFAGFPGIPILVKIYLAETKTGQMAPNNFLVNGVLDREGLGHV